MKIVYYGTGMCGKTTNLQYLHAVTKPDYRGKLLSVDTAEDRTLFFDLMPMELGAFKGYSVRLHLCTVPGQAAFDNTRRMILRGVDGVVFVADSQRAVQLQNHRSMASLRSNLCRQGVDPEAIPLVVQYNKRDLPNGVAVEEMRQNLRIARDTVQVEACANLGVGVSSTLKTIIKGVLEAVGDPSQLPEGRSASIIPGVRASLMPQAAPAVAQMRSDPGSGAVVIPKAPALPTFEQTAPLAKVS
ncbi:MAG TPA: GTPase domain-containing protein [Polyangiaceae bacterium]|nr:GTPase domain-containing protein [Polyangiaceae bacterium]